MNVRDFFNWLMHVDIIGAITSFIKEKIMGEYDYNEIAPGLFQSSLIKKKDIKILEDLKIDLVIDCNIEPECGFDPYEPNLLSYLFWPIVDGPNLPDIDELKAVAVYGYTYWKQQDKRVLVHCAAGMNRSGLVNGMILIFSGMSGKDAVNLIQQKRPGALSNVVFANYLQSQEIEQK